MFSVNLQVDFEFIYTRDGGCDAFSSSEFLYSPIHRLKRHPCIESTSSFDKQYYKM